MITIPAVQKRKISSSLGGPIVTDRDHGNKVDDPIIRIVCRPAVNRPDSINSERALIINERARTDVRGARQLGTCTTRTRYDVSAAVSQTLKRRPCSPLASHRWVK
jgi:hypothetical protein